MQVVVGVVAAALGYLASRSVVAMADSHRLDRPDNWWKPLCDTCEQPLAPALLRCSFNGHPQRTANAWIQALTIVVFVLIAVTADDAWLIPAYLAFGYVAVLLTVTDLDTKLIPNRILFPWTGIIALLLVLGSIASGEAVSLLRAGAGGVAYFVVMLILALIASGALGFGDVKLAFLLGMVTAYLSWGHLLVAGLGSFILGGVVAILLLVTRRVNRKTAIPFGPFMTTAAVLAVVVGDRIIDWYLG